jgi:uncharacterized protein DUF222
MAQVVIDIPDEVFLVPVDGVDTSRWDGKGVPAGVLLEWIDAQPFSAWSAAMLSQVDPAELGDQDLTSYLAACQRAESAAAARKSAAVHAVSRRVRGRIDPHVVDVSGHEVSVALRMPLAAAAHAVYRAGRLTTHLPLTRALFADGRLTERHVAKMIAGTGHLDQADCAAVEVAVLPDAEDVSVHEFARRVRRAVARIRPRDAKKRHDDAARQADVTVEHADDAMSFLNAYLPTVDALTVQKAVAHYAMARRKAGDKRPIGVLRAEALRAFADAYLSGTITGRQPTHHGRPVEVQICTTPEALVGWTDTPAEIPGVGPIPVEVVREIAKDARLRWMLIDGDTGRLLNRTPKTWRASSLLAAHAAATYVTSTGPHSTVPADRCDIDHPVRFGDGDTTDANTVPLDRGWHVPKTRRALLATRNPDGSITWTTPLGQTVTVHPYDYRLGP